MAGFGKGTLAAVMATAMAVVPSLAQDAKVAPAPTKATEQNDKPYLFEQVGDYSETHPVVVIGISKGSKDQITGEKIGDTLSDAIKKVHGVPSKYFVAPGGDYTAVIFAVNGRLFGPFGLKDSLGGMSLAANEYDYYVRHGIFPKDASASTPQSVPGGVFAKPEPKHE